VSEPPLPPPCPLDGDKPLGVPPEAPPRIVTPPPVPPSVPSRRPAVETTPDEGQGWWSSEGRSEMSGWLVSFVVHAVGLFLLGLITLAAQPGGNLMSLVAATGDGDADAAPGDLDQQPLVVEPAPADAAKVDSPKDDAPTVATPVDSPIEMPKFAPTVEKPTKADNNPQPAPGAHAEPSAPGNSPQAPAGGGWGGRDPAGRAKAAQGGGGTKKSEDAVERGLRWLAAHQRDDGSWCFDLNKPPCNGLCRNSGSEASTTAATGLALLPFLGAGYTHTRGEYKDTVKRGLYYLSTRALVTPQGVDLRDGGSMYAHGIATIAFCEAYGMTRDEALKEIAQGAIRFIVTAQDLQGGGWRYAPGEPGDTTVTGWQLMALKSGQMAKLEVPSPAISLVQKFLDSVQYDRGARYGYLDRTPRAPTHETTTAVGLLCRMYLGWNRNRPALYRGVTYLYKWGPSQTNMYYDYYATQVLHHFQGPEWQAWNKVMRDYLVATQAKVSHEAGSWYFPDPYGDRGGRLYNTAMAIMILEVYYRHMPLYGDAAVHDRF
jgi:hypothetical protein